MVSEIQKIYLGLSWCCGHLGFNPGPCSYTDSYNDNNKFDNNDKDFTINNDKFDNNDKDFNNINNDKFDNNDKDFNNNNNNNNNNFDNNDNNNNTR